VSTSPDLPLLVGNGRDESHPVPQSQVTMTRLMDPQDANLTGNVFGGVILAAVDRIAYVCATRHAGLPSVTASFDQVDFRSPIQIGEVVTLRASANTVGRTSMEIGVRVTAEPVTGGESRHTNTCYVTMVALDPDGRPSAVPRLEIRTEDEYRRYRDAEERRAARIELAKRRRLRRKSRSGG